MATTTYVPIQSYTLTGLTTTVTFSSIPSTYTDLRLVCSYKLGSAATGTNSFVRINGDTGNNYSYTYVIGTGSSAPSGRATSQNNMGVTVDVTDYYPVYQWDFQNYANTTTYKTTLLRQSAGSNQVAVGVYLWANTNAINQITFTAADNSGGSSGTPDQFAAGSTFTLYGIANAQIEAPKATGGIITYDNTYYYHTFGASGTFTPQQSLTADVLVIGAGGGGGRDKGAGGGAGGVCYQAGRSLSATGYSITVGSGGSGGTSGTGTSGGNSVFDTITANGGGGGGGDSSRNGLSGGSGGGASRDGTIGSATQGNSGGATGYGNNGGSGNNGTNSIYAGGGGGGAGAVGANAPTSGTVMASGGAGLATWSSWGLVTGVGENVSGTVYYAGGGGSGGYGSTTLSGGVGGAGGGGRGGSYSPDTPGTNAIVNTGGGGGGGGNASNGGNGGSGVVIIRYLKA